MVCLESVFVHRPALSQLPEKRKRMVCPVSSPSDVGGEAKAEMERLWRCHVMLPCVEVVETGNVIGRFAVVKSLGRGEFAEVLLGRGVEGDYAIKCIDKRRVEAAVDGRRRLRSVVRIGNEIEAMRRLRGDEGVARLLEAQQSSSKVYIVMELGDRDLYDAVSTQPGGFRDDLALKIAFDIVAVLARALDKGICHRDIKPENVLIKGDLQKPETICAKLCDFGLCGLARDDDDGDEQWNDFSDFVGSPGFFAPEILAQDTYDARKVDVWSLGCLLLEMIDGHDAFETNWLKTCYDASLLRKGSCSAFLLGLTKNLKHQLRHRSAHIHKFLREALVIHPHHRPTPHQLLSLLTANSYCSPKEKPSSFSSSSPHEIFRVNPTSDDSESDYCCSYGPGDDRDSCVTVTDGDTTLSLDIDDICQRRDHSSEPATPTLPDLGRRLALHTTPCAKRTKLHNNLFPDNKTDDLDNNNNRKNDIITPNDNGKKHSNVNNNNNIINNNYINNNNNNNNNDDSEVEPQQHDFEEESIFYSPSQQTLGFPPHGHNNTEGSLTLPTTLQILPCPAGAPVAWPFSPIGKTKNKVSWSLPYATT